MSVLREYVRMLLTEVAKKPYHLPSGIFVLLTDADDHISAKFTDKKGNRVRSFNGVVQADLITPSRETNNDGAIVTSGETYGAFEVTLSRADRGWGPMLYDVVMETATQKGSGLTPDRYDVSDAALGVWNYYLHQRPDVDHAQLDFEPGYPVHMTDDPVDDSTMQFRYGGLYDDDPNVRETAQEEYLDGSLSKVYYAVGTPMLDKLRAAGKLIEQSLHPDDDDRKLLREYIRALLIESTSSPKVLFMAGGPGSGKSYTIFKLGLKGKIEVINPDDQYEADLKHEGIPLDRSALLAQYRPLKDKYLAAKKAGDEEAMAAVEPEYLRIRSIFSRNMALFAKARNDATAAKRQLADSGQSFLVDGTGGNFNEINTQAQKFIELGYEVGMIFVDVPIELSVERNRDRGKKGKRVLEDEIVINSWNSVNKNVDKYRQLFGQNFFHINAKLDEFSQSVSENRPRLESFLGLA